MEFILDQLKIIGVGLLVFTVVLLSLALGVYILTAIYVKATEAITDRLLKYKSTLEIIQAWAYIIIAIFILLISIYFCGMIGLECFNIFNNL